MKAGIIAAGHGERLQHAGVRAPKPLLQVAGATLIEHTLNTVRAAGLREVVCIINEESAAVEVHCRERVEDLSLTFIHRTTPSSMESLFTLAPHLTSPTTSGLASVEPFLLLTVDSIIAPDAARDFMAAAAAHPDADGVLSVSTFIDDEKPLRVAADTYSRITAIGAPAAKSPLVTAGLYVFRPTIFAEIDLARRARFTALRQFLAHLIEQEYRLYAAHVPKCVDVDRPEDITTAELFIRSHYTR